MKTILAGLLILNTTAAFTCDELTIVDSIRSNLQQQKARFDNQFHTNQAVGHIHIGITKNDDSTYSATYTVKQKNPQYIGEGQFFVIDTQFDSKCAEYGIRRVRELNF